MPKADDPYYNRTRVPDEFTKDVGYTGLTAQEEFNSRERKYSRDGGDLRAFSRGSAGSSKPTNDPYYGRRRLSKQEIDGIGETGLTEDQEHLNRERKFSVNGVDVRKFGSTSSGGFHPPDDPYYGRTKVSEKLTAGIGESGNTPAQDYEQRERKQSVANFSGDPFAVLSGSGHRQSVAAGAVSGAAAAATRRRSSAAAPDAIAHPTTQHKSGYDGDDRLQPIVSKPELPPVSNVTGTGHGTAPNGEANYYDAATAGEAQPTSHTHTETPQPAAATTTTTSTTTHSHVQQQYDDPDSVAPDQVR